TVRQAGLGEQGASLFRIMGVAGQILGIAPGIGRVRALCRLGAALEDRLDVTGLVEGQVDRLAYRRLVQRRVLAVDADEGGHEGGGAGALELVVGGDGLYVLRFGRQRDLALATAQALQAHVAVRGDGEDQPVDVWFAGEV